MPADDVQIKWISRVEFAELTGSAASFELEPTGAVSFLFSDGRPATRQPSSRGATLLGTHKGTPTNWPQASRQ
jgi:hypothetical protein